MPIVLRASLSFLYQQWHVERADGLVAWLEVTSCASDPDIHGASTGLGASTLLPTTWW